MPIPTATTHSCTRSSTASASEHPHHSANPGLAVSLCDLASPQFRCVVNVAGRSPTPHEPEISNVCSCRTRDNQITHSREICVGAVSYTHLTLPTIYSV